tara:strand:+ start:218 stop:571 length:354 start_codon:yes stop_codon:yes gene_type:complete
MKNEVFKTDQTSEIGMTVKSSSPNSGSSDNGPILSNNINDAFVSIPAEELSKYQNKFSVFEKIPDIIKLSSDEIRLKKEIKQRKSHITKPRQGTDFSERLARISKQTKSINLDLDLN